MRNSQYFAERIQILDEDAQSLNQFELDDEVRDALAKNKERTEYWIKTYQRSAVFLASKVFRSLTFCRSSRF